MPLQAVRGNQPLVIAGMDRRRPHGPGRFRSTLRIIGLPAFPLSGPIPNFSDTGRLAVDVWSSDGATYLGTIPIIFSAQITERINEVASFSLQVPLEYMSVVSAGNLIKITREGEGIVFVGYADVLGVDDV